MNTLSLYKEIKKEAGNEAGRNSLLVHLLAYDSIDYTIGTPTDEELSILSDAVLRIYMLLLDKPVIHEIAEKISKAYMLKRLSLEDIQSMSAYELIKNIDL